MKEKTISEKIEIELEQKNEKDLIDKAVKRLLNRLRGFMIAEVQYDYKNATYQICKIEKKRFLGIKKWDKLTPFCFIKDKAVKSPHDEFFLKIELYDEMQILPIINQEMMAVANELDVKIRIILCAYGDGENSKLVFEEHYV